MNMERFQVLPWTGWRPARLLAILFFRYLRNHFGELRIAEINIVCQVKKYIAVKKI
jgi:hypothetical protein